MQPAIMQPYQQLLMFQTGQRSSKLLLTAVRTAAAAQPTPITTACAAAGDMAAAAHAQMPLSLQLPARTLGLGTDCVLGCCQRPREHTDDGHLCTQHSQQTGHCETCR